MQNSTLRQRKQKVVIVSVLILLVSLSSVVFSSLVPANAETSSNSDFEVKVDEVLELSLTNCDASNSSVVTVDVIPTTAGTFKSNCQTASVNTNAPGYSLSARSNSSTLDYQNPTTVTPTPTITSTSNTIATPAVLTNNTWGFAVENRLNFGSGFHVNDASNIFAQLSTTDTTIYQTDQFPITVFSHKFFYATRLTSETMAGTYSTTITYTAISNHVPDVGSFWRIEGRDIVNPYEKKTLLKGFNIRMSGDIGGYYPYQTPDMNGSLIENSQFVYDELEDLGVNVVRFNLRSRLFADDCTTTSCLVYDYKEEMFAKIEEGLEYAEANGIGVIINFHNTYGAHTGTSDAFAAKWDTFDQRNLDLTTQLWVDLATHFKDDNRILGYDIMNEPTVQILNGETIQDAITKWDVAAQVMIDAIREVDQNHIIIVERVNRGLRDDNGNITQVNVPTSYVFPSVSDIENNLMFEFHDYGLWVYADQDDDRIENDPITWPMENYACVIDASEISSGVEAWPPARFQADSDAQNTWVSVESNNGNPYAVPSGDPENNIADITLITYGTNLESNSEYYIDNIVVEEYDSNDNYLGVVYKQEFKYNNAFPSNSYGFVETNQSFCYDNEGGCYKISGPTSGIVNITNNSSNLKYFKVDSNKKYKVTAKVYGNNIPAGASMRVMLRFYYGNNEAVATCNKDYLGGNLQKFVKYSEENNIPVYNGEYGVLRNVEDWSKLGAEQFVRDSMEVYEENYINATYYKYYDWNTNATERRDGLRVREYAVSSALPITSGNTVLNTTLYNLFLDKK